MSARLMRLAEGIAPCICADTYEQVRDHFEFRPDNPRYIELPEVGRCPIWDVVGRKKDAPFH